MDGSFPIITNVADPEQPEVLTPEMFEATMVDRRLVHKPFIRNPDGTRRDYSPPSRPWNQVQGITLHQTACDMGLKVPRYDTIGAHFAVLRNGVILRMCDENRIVYHGHGWNNRCVGIEINGLYAGREDDPTTVQVNEALKSTWDDPTTPFREEPQQVTPEAMQSSRYLIRWLLWRGQMHGTWLNSLNAHRQAVDSRRNDPGEAIWRQVARPVTEQFRLTSGGTGFKLPGSTGYPLPGCWGEPGAEKIPY